MRSLWACAVACALCLAAAAQDDPAAAQDESATPAELGEGPVQGYPPGDVVKLVTGKELVGVQVLRTSPALVEIQLKPELPPMKVPRRQVVEILYDNVDPNAPASARPAEEKPAESPGLVPADKLSPELNQKLGMPLANTPRELKDKNFVHALREIAEELKIDIEFSPEVLALPPADKKWNTTLAAGATLRSVLEKDLPSAFPKIDINFDQYNKIVIRLRPADGQG
jgi:hypothetical protein